MTAEIIIMNASAIALAADSAATSSHGWGREKVFSSDNKIFELTDNAQVAVMNYGTADFMSIPWETVVGEYRRRHGGESFPQLRDYMDAFLRFLREEMAAEISQEKKEASLKMAAEAVFAWLAGKVQEREGSAGSIELEDEDNTRIGDLKEALSSRRQVIIAEILNDFHQRIQETERVPEATEELTQQASSVLKQALPAMFEEFEFDMDSTYARQLEEMAYASIVSMTDELTEFDVDVPSGIVVAGFGDDDLFPGYINVEIEGVYGGMLKWIERRQGQIAMPPKAAIQGFAQMNNYLLAAGVHSGYFGLISMLTRGILVEYTRQLLSELTDLNEEELERSVGQRSDEIEAAVGELDGAIEEFLWRDPGGPIDDTLEVVSVLPKDQLAEVAGAAISFTSLRRKISLDTETVGGPTDVAVITKDDGLVWVRRKDTVARDLNPEYYARMNGRGS